MKLDNHVALVTGAAFGIGRAIAELFAKENATVAMVDKDEPNLQAAAEAIRAKGGAVRTFAGDVVEEKLAVETIASVIGKFSRVDSLVTSAAVSTGKILTDTTEEEWDRVFSVNVKGTFLWCKAVLPHMMRMGRGSIVTLASQLALAGGRGNASYVATKGAIVSLTKSIALDYAEYGVRANVLVPGAIETPMLERSFARQTDPEAARRRAMARHPLGRIGTPEEVALGALHLASNDSSFTTGALLPIDGGWLAG
ncbi:MAG: SDR family oxidoreductase [Rhodospirillales bacterium]|jgi:NAD(P)-dependent dehydrogenase (short-subunit alcohol dehydrogenase family)|nr:SDR family oxidoreductase [Rhodospirillales bacterium]